MAVALCVRLGHHRMLCTAEYSSQVYTNSSYYQVYAKATGYVDFQKGMKLADACRISGVTFYAEGMGAHGYSMSICYKGKWYMTNVYNGIGLSKQGERKIDQFYEDTDDEGGTIKMVPSDFTSEGKVMDAMR